MARFRDKEKAIKLRLEGESYSQIKEIIGVSKSTLSYWLKDYPLSEKRIRELRDNNPRRIERYRATRIRKKQERLEKIYQEEKKRILPLTKRDILIAGLFLYWGEGGKTKESQLCVSNTNPATIKFFIKWLGILGISRDEIKIRLHLYKDMQEKKEIEFWSKELVIPKTQFRKSYIKSSNMSSITYKIKFNHGTCNAILDDARITEKIFADLKIIEDKLSRGYNL